MRSQKSRQDSSKDFSADPSKLPARRNLQNNVNLQLSDRDLHFKCARTHTVSVHGTLLGLAAPASASALHAAVARAVSRHDAAAGATAGGVAHVVHGLHGRSRVVHAAVFDGIKRAGLLDPRPRRQVRRDALLRWVAVRVLEGFAVELVGSRSVVASRALTAKR